MPDIAPVAPITTLDDPKLRTFLKPLVDGWNIRNGETDKGFVTRVELQNAVADVPTEAKEVDLTPVEARIARLERAAEATATQLAAQAKTSTPVATASSVKAYSSPSKAITITATAGATVMLTGRITYNTSYSRWNYMYVVTGVTKVGDDISVSYGAVPYTSEDYNGGGVNVKLLSNGTVLSSVIMTPNGDRFASATVTGVATCPIAGTYTFTLDDSERLNYPYFQTDAIMTAVVCG